MMFYQISTKTRIDEIVEIAMVEAIDRFKRDPLGTRSLIATIHHRRPGLETMKAALSRGSTVLVPRDFVRNELLHHHRHQQEVISVLEMISNNPRLDRVLQGEVCKHGGECARRATEL